MSRLKCRCKNWLFSIFFLFYFSIFSFAFFDWSSKEKQIVWTIHGWVHNFNELWVFVWLFHESNDPITDFELNWRVWITRFKAYWNFKEIFKINFYWNVEFWNKISSLSFKNSFNKFKILIFHYICSAEHLIFLHFTPNNPHSQLLQKIWSKTK